MLKCGEWPIGVCNWSLQTDVAGVAEAMRKLGIRPALEQDAYLAAVQQQNWVISSTMIDFPQEDYSTLESIRATGGIVPDEHWEDNRKLFFGAVDATVALSVKYLSMHAGFIDDGNAEYAGKFRDRITCLADAAGAKQIMLLLETGQETANELRGFLEELNHPAVGVNFDPANMILYDKGDPVEAVQTLAPWIRHVHVKDAVRTTKPGTWGTEVPWGQGQVPVEVFLGALAESGFDGVLAIEREAGNDKLGNIRQAVERLNRFAR